MAATTPQTHVQHLYLRAGFGAKIADVQSDTRKSIKALVKKLFQDSQHFAPIRVVETNTVHRRNLTAMAGAEKDLSPDDMKLQARESKLQIKELNGLWLERMSHGTDTLRQKMALFWHGHFACQSRNVYFVQDYLNTLQEHALGNFGNLLLAISKTPAMLQFLNNQQNRKSSPNENFARELMELFTLGKGNYTEQDIKNAARAFTGWGFSPEGEFVFRQHQHDTDVKTLFGKTGNFTGEEVIQLILHRKETALFLSQKIYRYFVNEKADPRQVQEMAARLYKSGYNLKSLLEYVFTSDWFYDAAHVGTRIKSPLELIAGLNRLLDIQYEDKTALVYAQKVLGQVALYPPNVAGWPEGKNWIDSSRLLFRLQWPAALFQSTELTTEAKDEGDADAEHLSQRQSRQIVAQINWTNFLAALASYPDSVLPEQLAGYLFQVPLSEQKKKWIGQEVARYTNREELLKHLTLQLLSLPEYQLC